MIISGSIRLYCVYAYTIFCCSVVMNYDNPYDSHERCKRRRGYGQYPSEEDADAPVPPALAVPDCRCGSPAEVQQSRHPNTAGRAYYVCKKKYMRSKCRFTEILPCWFFQWIDGPEKYDPRIRLFPYESEKLVPYHEFRRWVPPPPNPPPMTVDERMAAS